MMGGQGHGAAGVDRFHTPLGKGFPGHGGSAWTGLPQRSQAGDLTVRPGPGWKVEGRSGRVSVELMGFVWDLSGEEPASRAAEGK